MLVYLLTIPTTREYTVHNILLLNVPTNKRVVRITNWLFNNAGTTQGRCASAAFHDRANRETDWRLKLVILVTVLQQLHTKLYIKG